MSAGSPDPQRREPEQVRSMFGSLVDCYDRLNATMTLGMDRSWRKGLVHACLKHQPEQVLDLACGTGDVALLLQQAGITVTAADFCEPMLVKAKEKGVRETIVADALELPFPDQSFDAVTVAWGFRNFTDRHLASLEVFRVLRPGGWFHILESAEPEGWTRPFHRLYCHKIIPKLGQWIAGNDSPYRYLVNTVADFPNAQNLATQLEKAGFSNTSWKIRGFGAVALHHAQKKQA